MLVLIWQFLSEEVSLFCFTNFISCQWACSNGDILKQIFFGVSESVKAKVKAIYFYFQVSQD